MAMNYVVHWTEEALDELAAAWTATSDRNAVTAASYRLESDLAREAYKRGIPRNSTVNRTATDLPLGIDYEIIEDDRKIRIVRVWTLV
jgi:hypothetical protein